MLAAVERQKFVFILNRDARARLAIGSPLEAHKSYQICFDLCALDVGFENPVFASLELNYEALDAPAKSGSKELLEERPIVKHVAFWEVDLGLNHVVRKCLLTCDKTAAKIIPVPAGAEFSEGPGGVLVCCENCIQFKKPDHPDLTCMFPRRINPEVSGGTMITTWTTHKMKDFFFILLQTEYGDLYRVELVSEGPVVKNITCRYFDTVPVASVLCVLKTGFLFAASEMGAHVLYQFTGIGADEETYVCSALTEEMPPPFRPRPLHNLIPVSDLNSLGPMTDLKVIDCLGDTQTPQLYALCGAGPRSYLNIMKQGLHVEEMAASEVPGYPTGLWTLHENYDDAFHKYLLLSFSLATLVLRVSDSIEEQTATQFITNKATLHAGCLHDNSHIQVTEDGWRLLQQDPSSSNAEARRVLDWRPQAGRRVLCATSNGTQLLLSVSGGFLLYFELQSGSLGLREIGQHDLGHEVTCLALQPVTASMGKAMFAAVGGIDRSVRIFSLDKEKLLFRQVAVQILAADTHAESVCIALLPFSQLEKNESKQATTLCIGLSTGVLLRIPMDAITGQLHSHRRQKFLGAQPVKTVPLNLKIPTDDGGKEEVGACLALSSKSWLAYSQKGYFRLAGLLFSQIDYAASLNSVHCETGYVAISGNILRILSLDIDSNIDSKFSSVRVPLEYTPRKLTAFPPPPLLQERQDAKLKAMPIMLLPPSKTRPWLIAEIEGDHNAFDMATKREIQTALAAYDDQGKGEGEESEEGHQGVTEAQVGTFKAGPGKWGGALRLINPATGTIQQTIAFGIDECPVSIAVCQFVEYPLHPSLVVGTVTGLKLKKNSCQNGTIKVYMYDDQGQLTLHHETIIEDSPLALCAWNGRLLAAVGNRIRIYTLGKKRLLKRCEYKNLPCGVNWLRVSGKRVFASDIREGFHVLNYSAIDNVFSVLADMTVPRWVTCGDLLDPYTIIGGDKFENLFVVRIPPDVISDNEVFDSSGLKVRGDTAYLTGQTHKFESACEFYLGDIPMAMQKCLMTPGGSEFVLFGTIMGSIGAFLPLQTQREVETLQQLEMLMRNEDVSLVGREHIFFRSAMFPVKNVIDGDLLSVFPKLKPERQTWIAQQLDKTSSDIMRLLDEIHSRII
eukprot:Blabericola_migrator_1__1066@NODE_1270_length_4934_cov_107_196014_g857_i0_p1_GENE_NODE_1270_length_4934_cov_107_196014_g857_i0NODE_1270_length_4934_cov_107_196014_g857_i0_p1_ORF_typecomplete_len1253_score244_13MMS1_N/PF10433_9/1_8e123CPSF_A/PF03178_15/8_5CPSF_A/PF03178_15/1_8CPSF_A/PF03178_15/6_4e68CNH/PF00780_22/35CNH/PF00780_22/1_7e02CNH/PF00780_22/3_9HPIP_like/PF18524_1/11HPIP_like/PF18524_1/44_NODE_1270_length_4934_cov_107_196014_g857_i03733759